MVKLDDRFGMEGRQKRESRMSLSLEPGIPAGKGGYAHQGAEVRGC